MTKKAVKYIVLLVSFALLIHCAGTRTNVDFFATVMSDLQTENYQGAVLKIDQAKKNKTYTKKDRVLYYLDKGVLLHYMGEYQESNKNLEAAEQAMEELFTRSISKAALSLLLNDNSLAYHGEIYENLYVNIFKALNYLKLDKFDDAYVEIKRVNTKLRELDEKYGELAKELSTSDDSEAKVEYKSNHFYDDVLAHFISHLIFRAEGEYDDSRISLQKMISAQKTQPDIFNYKLPKFIRNQIKTDKLPLTIMAFTGRAPQRKAVGGMITTYKDYIGISDLTMPLALPNFPFPGMKPGYHFKFAFPVLDQKASGIDRVQIILNNHNAGNLEILEDMGRVAEKTFESSRNMIYTKTLIRTVIKGLASAEAKKKLKKEAGANAFFGALIDAAVDAGVDATENPDLRCWRTMPQKCFVGEYYLQPGNHNIRVRFLNANGMLIKEKVFENFAVDDQINLINVVSVN